MLVVGTFQETADLDPGVDKLELISAGADDAFILNLDGNGELVYAASLGGDGNDRGYGVVSSGTGALYLTGWFAGTTDLDPGSGSLRAVSVGSNDAFLVKLIESDGTGIDDLSSFAATGFAMYPNPANERVTLMLDAITVGREGVIERFDATGKRVYTEHVPSLKVLQPFDLSRGWHHCLYLVMLRVEGLAPGSGRVMVR